MWSKKVSLLTPVAAANTDKTNIQNFFRNELLKQVKCPPKQLVSPNPSNWSKPFCMLFY